MKKVNIKTTKDHSIFSLILGNRIVSEKKVHRLMDSITSGFDLTPYCPIIVSKTMQVIDGQHRLEACKRLNITVHYVVAENISIRQIAAMNSATDKWKIADFVKCYMNLGIEDYFILEDFRKKYNLSYGLAASLLVGSPISDGGSVPIKEAIQDGKFKVKNLNSATIFMEQYKEVEVFLEKPRNRVMLASFQHLYKKDSFEQSLLVKKLKSTGKVVDVKSTVRKTIIGIEELYNFRARKRTILAD